MKKLILTFTLAFLFLSIGSINAQSYSSAVGVRLGYGLNASYKKELKESMYADIYAGFGGGSGYSRLFAGAAVELHKSIENVDNLYWYYGGGAYLGSYNYKSGYGDNYFYVGINGVLGLDYTFEEIPLNLSADWMPGFNIIGGGGFYGAAGGLSVRYILGSE